MEIKYEIIPEDLTYYSKEAAVGTSFHKMQALIIVAITVLFMIADMLIAVVAVFMNDGTVQLDSFHMLPRMLVAFAIGGVTYVTLMTVSKRGSRKAANHSGKNGFFCEHTLKIDNAGLVETTHVNQNFSSWEGVEKITETPNYVTIHIRLSSAYIIPKRAFSTPEEKDSFVSSVQNYITAANPFSTPPPPPPLDLTTDKQEVAA